MTIKTLKTQRKMVMKNKIKLLIVLCALTNHQQTSAGWSDYSPTNIWAALFTFGGHETAKKATHNNNHLQTPEAKTFSQDKELLAHRFTDLRNEYIQTTKDILPQLKETEKSLLALEKSVKTSAQQLEKSPYAPTLELIAPATGIAGGALAGYLVYKYGLQRLFTTQGLSPEAIKEQARVMGKEIELKEIEYNDIQKKLSEATTDKEQKKLERKLERLDAYFSEREEKLNKLEEMLTPEYQAGQTTSQKIMDWLAFGATVGIGSYAGYLLQKSFFEKNPYYRTATATEISNHAALEAEERKLSLLNAVLTIKKQLYGDIVEQLATKTADNKQATVLAKSKNAAESLSQSVAQNKASELEDSIETFEQFWIRHGISDEELVVRGNNYRADSLLPETVEQLSKEVLNTLVLLAEKNSQPSTIIEGIPSKNIAERSQLPDVEKDDQEITLLEKQLLTHETKLKQKKILIAKHKRDFRDFNDMA